MDPVCKRCGLRHPAMWTAFRCDQNKLATNKQEVANTVVNSTPEVANTVANNDVKVANWVANRHGKYADLEKRKAYMREYMRKRRGQQT